MNPVKVKMAAHPEDYKWSSYRTIINLQEDKITESQKTLSYFGTKGVYAYREFVENAAQKYNSIGVRPYKENKIFQETLKILSFVIQSI